MQIIAYDDDGGRPAIGIRLEDGVLPTGHTDLTASIKAGPRELDRLRQASESPNQLVHPLRLRAPISPTSSLLLAGGNYADHLAETGLHPTEPVFFSKLRSAVIGPDEPIRIPTPRDEHRLGSRTFHHHRQARISGPRRACPRIHLRLHDDQRRQRARRHGLRAPGRSRCAKARTPSAPSARTSSPPTKYPMSTPTRSKSAPASTVCINSAPPPTP